MTAAGPATASSGRPCGGWHDLLRPRGHWTRGERNWQGLTASDAREHELFVQFEYVTSPVDPRPHAPSRTSVAGRATSREGGGRSLSPERAAQTSRT